MKQPVSTYRLQITERFDLHSAAGVADYVRRLGADWLYLSPLLQAEEGSDHGYDVVDTSRIDPARGGTEGLAAASAAARGSGLGVLVDIVPNHMGVATPAQNRWWWDVLEHGRDSRSAEAFDIDWDAAAGTLRLPVLGDGTESDPEAALDELTIEGDELRYYDNRFPIAAGTATAGATPREVHDRQHYALVHWRRADAELNYRRFFAVNTLAGVRVEVPWVFDESHREILRWIDEGLVDGLRIDHPDGLRDPGGYLDRLAEATKGAYVLVEKITEGDEQLPSSWATQGTTGYDALGDFDRVLVDPKGEAPLTSLETRLRGGRLGWAQLIHDTKRGIADGILRSEVLRLAREIGAATGAAPGEAGGTQVADAVAELLTCFPVYRSYLPEGLHHLEEAAALAKRHRPDLADTIDELVPVLSDAGSDAASRFQQTSGMVMAKGVEDTAFYRWARLSSLTEVGGDPDEFAITTEEFHERQLRRQESWPSAMTTLSTHDTKRGEDVRARIDVLAEVPEEWAEAVDALQTAVPLGSGRGSDDVFANLLWQAVVGSWPASRERLHAYAEKASREAGDSTTWTDVDEDFEASMHAAVDAAFDDPAVHRILEGVATRLQAPGWSNSLSMKLLQLTAPGVPDVYQGSELWETSLVDPDNRRDVDYAERRRLLDELDAGALPPIDATGAAKLLVVSRALRLRRDRPELFTGYVPVRATGERAAHVVAFDRGGAVTVATRLPVALAEAGGWGTTTVALDAPAVDVLTGQEHPAGDVPVADLLAVYPVALLAPLGGTA